MIEPHIPPKHHLKSKINIGSNRV